MLGSNFTAEEEEALSVNVDKHGRDVINKEAILNLVDITQDTTFQTQSSSISAGLS